MAAWPAPGQRPGPWVPPDPNAPPAWHRGDEVESQAFLQAMGITLE